MKENEWGNKMGVSAFHFLLKNIAFLLSMDIFLIFEIFKKK